MTGGQMVGAGLSTAAAVVAPMNPVAGGIMAGAGMIASMF
jgi:hypothetical protein